MSAVSVQHQYRAQRYPSHSHGEYQMIYVTAGEVRLLSGREVRTVSAPAVMLLGNLRPHAIESVTEVYERYTVTIPPQGVGGVIEEVLLSPFQPHGEDFSPVIALDAIEQARLDALFASLSEEAASTDFPDAPDAIVRLILMRLRRISPSSFPERGHAPLKWIEEVRRTLERDLAEKLSLEELGERFHVSVYHLARLFRRETGYTIGKYRLLCRIAAARDMLLHTENTVGEIAAAVGFGDVSNFSRYFRRETGLSPLAYRRKFRG